ncbi:MAG: serine protease [Hyphomicrobiaceae bacterium]
MFGLTLRLAFASVTMGILAQGASSQAIDKNRIWEDHKTAVVRLRASGTGADGTEKALQQGTGVIISSDGFILTALHVVGFDEDWQRDGPQKIPQRRVEVQALDDRGVPYVLSTNASVRAVPGSDLAILRVDGTCHRHANLTPTRPQGFPALVAIVWGSERVPRPLSTDLTTTNINKDGDVLTVERIGAVEGNSGSPLFDSEGRVIGLLTNKLGDNGALAAPSTDVFGYLPFDPKKAGGYPLSCYANCAHDSHSIERWSSERSWRASSGWRRGGYDPESYCARVVRDSAKPGYQVTCTALPEASREVPIRHFEYQYYCDCTERSGPIYKTQRSFACGLLPSR